MDTEEIDQCNDDSLSYEDSLEIQKLLIPVIDINVGDTILEDFNESQQDLNPCPSVNDDNEDGDSDANSSLDGDRKNHYLKMIKLQKRFPAETASQEKCFTCKQCSVSFSSDKKLSLHHYLNKLNEDGDCVGLARSYCCDSNLGNHSESPQLVCEICQMSFVENSELRSHVESYHTDEILLRCSECNSCFPGKHGLKDLVDNIHKNSDIVKCEKCHGSVQAPTDSVHSNMNFAQCADCQTKFDEFKSHDNDKNLPSKVRPHHCPHCDAGFISKPSLIDHINAVHYKLKTYRCTECTSSFTQKSSLKTHINCVHKKIKRFSCEECPFTFSSKQGLKCHVDAVHNKVKRYACQDCDSRFTQKSSLATHIRSVHWKIKPFRCSVCNESFPSKQSLSKHASTFHAAQEIKS